MAEIVVETVKSITPELVAAIERLLPQSHPTLPPPTVAELDQVVECPATTLLVARDPESADVIGTATVRRLSDSFAHARSSRECGRGRARTWPGRRCGVDQRGGSTRSGPRGSVIELNTNPRREVANRLYQRLGFERHYTNNYWIKF